MSQLVIPMASESTPCGAAAPPLALCDDEPCEAPTAKAMSNKHLLSTYRQVSPAAVALLEETASTSVLVRLDVKVTDSQSRERCKYCHTSGSGLGLLPNYNRRLRD